MFSESIPGMCCFMRLEAGGSFLLFFLFMSCPFFLSFLVRSFSSWHERFIADGGWRLFLSFLSLLGHRSCSFLVHAFLCLSWLVLSCSSLRHRCCSFSNQERLAHSADIMAPRVALFASRLRVRSSSGRATDPVGGEAKNT